MHGILSKVCMRTNKLPKPWCPGLIYVVTYDDVGLELQAKKESQDLWLYRPKPTRKSRVPPISRGIVHAQARTINEENKQGKHHLRLLTLIPYYRTLGISTLFGKLIKSPVT